MAIDTLERNRTHTMKFDTTISSHANYLNFSVPLQSYGLTFFLQAIFSKVLHFAVLSSFFLCISHIMLALVLSD